MGLCIIRYSAKQRHQKRGAARKRAVFRVILVELQGALA